MDKRVEALEKELACLKQRQARLARANGEFVSVVSHELKTPLTGVKLFADLMLSDLEAAEIEAQRKYLNIIKAEADRMARALANVTDFLSLSSATMIWRESEVDVVKLCDRCASLFQALCETKGIRFVYRCQPAHLPMVADAERLIQLMYNLLANALRHTAVGEVSLRVAVLDSGEEAGCLEIEVSDSGSGIERDRLEGLLRFDEEDFDIRRGIGLFVADAIARHHGGTLMADSRLGEGASFKAVIPL